ncbi:lipid-A-disaccharide synthase [Marinicella sp. S1101]|uniref:lipid-A-disaccharide synthase n=1 Tax=Marinicella marina TaxID=2996016 RepID=UPI0022609621|nr:lipid-A-disaccharide synthase [Marinicella marina]MCX7554817.1 lipid-A-disaccharide synthase [Marinicella marina]MDJ1140950.1 lipid-A-disaccharide synthase [Marinicella marina]
MPARPVKIAVVAGEASSDMLGAALLKDLVQVNLQIEVIAVGGNKIRATQARIIQDNEVFSVMGLVEVLKDLPSLLKVKKHIVEQIIAFKPDVFIGIDSPDLNFSIAKAMKKNAIPVIHYVSPSVWAWRPKRIFKMQKFIDALLTLFPFEVRIYEQTSIKAQFVGHPLAQQIPVKVNKKQHKTTLGMADKKVLAMLPGSRNREIKTLVPLFARTIKQLNLGDDWVICSSNISAEKIALTESLTQSEGLQVKWIDDATELLQAADFALLGSGTVALESMLCKTPMVVAYKISAVTWWLVKTFKMMQLDYYSLPNVLHGDFLVPEVMQTALTIENLTSACEEVINRPDPEMLIAEFEQLHQTLLPPHPHQAALAVQQFLEQRS